MLIVFLPKENIYYFILENIKKDKIELTQNSIQDKYLKFIVDDIKINYEGVEVSQVGSFDLDLFIYRTAINLDKIKVDESFNKFVPSKIDNLSLTHTIFNPLYIDIDAKFKLGSCVGEIDLLNRIVSLNIIVAKGFKTRYRYMVNQLKLSKERSNNKEDVYTYEYKF